MARLFIGTLVPAYTLEDALKASGIREKETGLRWAPPPQWHVTALFIGPRRENEIPAIAQKAEAATLDIASFDLLEGRWCAMPAQSPSMLWVRFLPSPHLDQLHRVLALATASPVSSFSPLWPHITMARGRVAGTLPDTAPVLDRFRVDHLTLFRSDPGPVGTVHSPLHHWRLK